VPSRQRPPRRFVHRRWVAAFAGQLAFVARTVAIASIAPVSVTWRRAFSVTAQQRCRFRSSPLALSGDQPNYGHSVGKVQTKAEFVDGAAKLHWKSIVASDETVSIVGDIAISRFTVAGESESHGKVSAVKLGALMVWLEQDGHWKLLARRAVKL
jgi:hypothetical protein